MVHGYNLVAILKYEWRFSKTNGCLWCQSFDIFWYVEIFETLGMGNGAMRIGNGDFELGDWDFNKEYGGFLYFYLLFKDIFMFYHWKYGKLLS